MKAVHIATFILLVVGGLNWGLVGIGAGDVITRFLGAGIAQVAFILVGVAAIVEIATHKKSCKACEAGGSASASTGPAV